LSISSLSKTSFSLSLSTFKANAKLEKKVFYDRNYKEIWDLYFNVGDVMKNVEELSMTNTNNLRRRLGLWTFLQRMLGSPKAVATNKSENNKTDVTSKNQSGKNYDESPTITEENIGK